MQKIENYKQNSNKLLLYFSNNDYKGIIEKEGRGKKKKSG